MNEIKCPKCGTTFTIDESAYDNILKQVRDNEFNKEIVRQEELYKKEKETSLLIERKKIEDELNKVINDKDKELLKLNNELANINKDNLNNKKIEISELKENFNEQINLKDQEIIKLNNIINNSKKENELKEKNLISDYENKLKEKDQEVSYYKDLKTKLSTKLVGES